MPDRVDIVTTWEGCRLDVPVGQRRVLGSHGAVGRAKGLTSQMMVVSLGLSPPVQSRERISCVDGVSAFRGFSVWAPEWTVSQYLLSIAVDSDGSHVLKPGLALVRVLGWMTECSGPRFPVDEHLLDESSGPIIDQRLRWSSASRIL